MRVMNKQMLWISLAVLSGFSPLARAEDDGMAAVMNRKVIVDTAKAELCFETRQDCHPVLIGKATPKGRFEMHIYQTSKAGYGGDVIGFKEDKGFLFALHRVWTLKPSERRLERIASSVVADRVITNGCINVTNDVYDRLKSYFVLEVI